jgi:hypothetical protein
VLVVQLDHRGRLHQRHRDRRVVHGQHGAELGRGGQLLAQPLELDVVELAVVEARDAGVERDDAEPAHVVHAVLEAVVVGVEQLPGVRRPLVVVAHHPHHLRAEAGRDRLDHLAQPAVGLRLAAVGEVAGEHQDVRGPLQPGQPVERQVQPGLGLDHAVLAQPAAEQVDVAEVGDGDVGCGMLAVLHAPTLGGRLARVDRGQEG